MTKINLASHSDQRVGIFIDTQNLYHSARSNFRANVNYQELIKKAVNGRKLIRAFAYVIRSAEMTEEKFFDALEDIGIEIKVKDLQVFHTGAKKADWDVGLAVDMIRMTEKVDTVVLASGDGDFLEVLRYCKSRGVRVEVMAFDKTTNSQLMEEADFFVDLGESGSNFLISNRRKSQTRNSYAAQEYPEQEYSIETGIYTPDNNIYGGSNLSTVNRMTNQNNTPVNPKIFAKKTRPSIRNNNRKVRPVVGLPARNKNDGPYIGNAFGNQNGHLK
jgi:uncharacterized LabA/DUF88 family protein